MLPGTAIQGQSYDFWCEGWLQMQGVNLQKLRYPHARFGQPIRQRGLFPQAGAGTIRLTLVTPDGHLFQVSRQVTVLEPESAGVAGDTKMTDAAAGGRKRGRDGDGEPAPGPKLQRTEGSYSGPAGMDTGDDGGAGN